MLAPPALLVDRVTWHEAAARVHVAGVERTEVLPLPPLWLKLTVPVAPPEGYPATVAVQVLGEPTTTGEGAQPTETELGD